MSDQIHDPEIRGFLDRTGHRAAVLTPLPGDASARRYLRLEGAGLLLMSDATDAVGYAAFLRLAEHLGALGLSAPRIIASEPAAGLALIEDFGEATYARLLKKGADETALYELALDALLHLHRSETAKTIAVPPYDLALFLDEVSIFSDWFVPTLRPDLDRRAFDADFRALWRAALSPVSDRRDALVLRDFHIDNLMLLDGRQGVARCGLLDFQDAVIGLAEYDLVSLLQDARRDLAPGLESHLLARYLDHAPRFLGTREEVTNRFHLMGAQRHTRIAGLFLRLDQRDGKPGYLRFLPRVIGQMQRALADAGLTQIEAMLDTTLPGWREAGADLAHPR